MVLLFLLLPLLAACTRDAPKPQKLNVYCSVQLEWCELIAKTYAERTGVTLNMTRKSAGEALAQVTAERMNPRADIWFGGTGDAHVQAALALLTEPYRSSRLDELHASGKPPIVPDVIVAAERRRRCEAFQLGNRLALPTFDAL